MMMARWMMAEEGERGECACLVGPPQAPQAAQGGATGIKSMRSRDLTTITMCLHATTCSSQVM